MTADGNGTPDSAAASDGAAPRPVSSGSDGRESRFRAGALQVADAVDTLFTRVLPGGRYLLTGMQRTAPTTKHERQKLRSLGVDRRQLWRLRRAAYAIGLGGQLAVASVFSGVLSLTLMSDSGGSPQIRNASEVLLTAAVVAGFAAAFALTAYLSPRRRLRAALVQCVRLTLLLDPQHVTLSSQRYLRRRLHDPAFRRKKLDALAWVINRDMAQLAGQRPHSAGLGAVLLWYGQNPFDPKRRPTLDHYLSDVLVAAASLDATVAAVDFVPAGRFRTISPRRRLLTLAKNIAGGAVTTGIIVAIVTAILRIWFK